MTNPVIARKRILLDTNVWSNLAEHREIEQVRLAARTAGVGIVASPAVVYELLRSPNADLRRRDLRAITGRGWIRPMTEICQQADELRRQIERMHPEWMKSDPDLRSWRLLRSDWSGAHPPGRTSIGGFWWRARNEPAFQSKILALTEGDELDKARQSQKALKAAFANGRSFENTVLTEWKGRFERSVPGWDGDEFDSWRGFCLQQWSEGLFRQGESPHKDWLGPYIDLGLLRRDAFGGWVRFWIYELNRVDVPL